MKSKRGITLIALVVTIIVLLILAGVTLSFVAGENGILKRATEAVDINEKATAEEEANLVVVDLASQYYEEKYVNHKEVEELDEYLKTELKTGKETATGNYIVIADTVGKIEVLKVEQVISTGKIENGRIEWSEDEIEDGKPEKPSIGKDETIEFSYEIIARNGEDIKIAIKIKDEINGIKKIELPQKAPFLYDNVKEVNALEYMVKIGEEYTVLITNGKGEIQKETILIEPEMKVLGGVVQYDAGEWTSEEIAELENKKLYDINKSKEGGHSYEFKLNDDSGLGFTFGGFTYKGDTENEKDIQDGVVITSRNQSVSNFDGTAERVANDEGWIIFQVYHKDEKNYVTSLIHAGCPENFVFMSKDKSKTGYQAEYLLSSGKRCISYNTLDNGTPINPRDWDMYKDVKLSEKGYIENIHLMTYSEAQSTNSKEYDESNLRNIGCCYTLASAYQYNSRSLVLRAVAWNGMLSQNFGYSLGIRPVVSLTDGVYIASGSGTQQDPYVLAKD